MSSNQKSHSFATDQSQNRNYVIHPTPFIFPISNSQPVQIIQTLPMSQSFQVLNSQNIYTPPSSQLSVLQAPHIPQNSQNPPQTSECQTPGYESDSDVSISTVSDGDHCSKCSISKVSFQVNINFWLKLT